MEGFILQMPEWEEGITFSREWIVLILVAAVLAAGILLCFWGYRYFQTIILVLLGCGAIAAGYLISREMTDRLILQMCIVVMLAFLQICLFYFLASIGSWLLRRFRMQAAWQKCVYIVSPVLGAVIVGGVIYTQIYRSVAAACIPAAVIGAAGMGYSKKRSKQRRVFYTYEDLLRLEMNGREKADD